MGDLLLLQNDINKSRQIFESLLKELNDHLLNVDFKLEHIGSTAIPNAFTKPVLDVLLIANNYKTQQKIAQLLPALGFMQGELSREQTKLFFYREISDSESFLNSIHLHLVCKDSNNKNDLISLEVRDYLLIHPEEVKAYNRVKEKLAKEGNNDRSFYVTHKEKFMNELLARMDKASSNFGP